MINLIPPEGKKVLKREFILRVSGTSAFLLGIVCLILVGSLVPTYVLTSAQIQEYEKRIETVGDTTQKYKEAEQEIKKIGEVLTQLKSGSSTRPSTELFREVERLASPGIVFKSFQINTDKRVGDSLLVQGVAPTRESLVVFKNALKTSSLFEKADIPISDLARDVELPFTITISLKKLP